MSTCPRPVAAACPWPSFDTAIHQLWDPIRGAAPLPARVHSRPVSCIIRAHSHATSFARKHEESIPSKIRGRCDNSLRCWGNSSRSTHRPAVFKQSEPGSCTLAQHRVPELRCRITGPKSRESSVRVGHGRTWSSTECAKQRGQPCAAVGCEGSVPVSCACALRANGG